MTNKNTNTYNYSVLEFEEIKENLKNYLKKQDAFKDYNFEGSNLSILMDILAYNSHYNNAYMSFTVNENFLISASRRHNVISIADQLGYIPFSARCSESKVNIIMTDFENMPDSVVIDSNIKLTTVVDDNSFKFNIKNDKIYKGRKVLINSAIDTSKCEYVENEEDANAFLFEDVEIIEGVNVINYFDVDSDEQYKFPILNPLIDMNTINITVFPDADILEQYTKDPNYINTNIKYPIFSLYNNDDVFSYYYREIDSDYYEIIFRQGYLKKGNVIKIDYMVSSGEKANGAKYFVLENYNSLFSSSSYVPKTVNVIAEEQTHSGHDKESLESIKENAPRFYASQNRAITSNDFKALLVNKFGYIDTISVTGGETLPEPITGKVYIAIKPKDNKYLTQTQKDEILTFLEDKKISSIGVEIIDVNYINMILNVNVTYNQSKQKAKNTYGTMYDEISNIIMIYTSKNLKIFNDVFEKSQLIYKLIDELIYISSVNIDVKLSYNIDTSIKDNNKVYEVNFSNELIKDEFKGTLSSDSFNLYTNNRSDICNLSDDGKGNILLNNITQGTTKTIGTINYSKGYLEFSEILTPNNSFNIYVLPKNNDLKNSGNNLLNLYDKDININLTEELNAKFTGE